MEPDEFAGLFKSFQRSAFRLETLSYYAVEGELELLFRRFLEGEPRPPLEEWAAGKGWVDLVSGGIAAGKAFQRVHLIRGPLTDYLRFEIEWGYLYSAPLGEEFRILSIGQDETLDDLPHEDFWLFDDNLAISMVYDDEGRFVGAMAVVDSAALETYRRRRDSALARSVPLEEYLAALAGSSSA